VGLVNRKGIRQALPAGKVTKASVYDLIPFENEVVVAKVPGDALLKVLDNMEARVAGFKPKAGPADSATVWVDAKGAPVDPKRTYSVATTDYLYLGGDGFALNEADKAPVQTRTSWQSALINWTTEKKTDEKKPLESLLKGK
jgi:5'-nucleotidase/UDP-sugar diphosphatase